MKKIYRSLWITRPDPNDRGRELLRDCGATTIYTRRYCRASASPEVSREEVQVGEIKSPKCDKLVAKGPAQREESHFAPTGFLVGMAQLLHKLLAIDAYRILIPAGIGRDMSFRFDTFRCYPMNLYDCQRQSKTARHVTVVESFERTQLLVSFRTHQECILSTPGCQGSK